MRKILVVFLFHTIFSYGQKTSYDAYFNKLIKKCFNNKCHYIENNDSIFKCVINNQKFEYKVYKNTMGKKEYRLNILPVDSIEGMQKILFDVVNRELGYYLLINNKDRKERTRIKQIKITKKNHKLVTVNDIYNLTQDFNNITITKKLLNYKIGLFSNKIKDTIIILFPVDYNIVFDKNKDELITDMYKNLLNQRDLNVNFSYSKQDMQPYKNGLKIYNGEQFLIGEMNNNFYTDNQGDFIFNKNFITESFSNLFITNLSNDKKITVNLKIKKYNGDFYQVKLPLKNILAYFDNMKKFFGIETVTNKQIRGSLLLYNPELSYMHLLDIKSERDSLFDENIMMEIKMYPYLPAHNIKELFGIEKQ